MLQFEPSWRFTSPGPIPRPVVQAFYGFVEKIAGQGETWSIVEKFKYYFSGGMGSSSSLSWAWSDLSDCMYRAAENAPLFIEAFYKCCSDCEASGFGVPDLTLINSVLAEHKACYELRPPYLVATNDYMPIAVPEKTPSLAAQARPMIDEALAASDRLLNGGNGRQAVSELLWLLETIRTAFRRGKARVRQCSGQVLQRHCQGDEGQQAGQRPGTDLELDDNAARLPVVSNWRRCPPWH